jgi:hypothetical protein
MMGLERILAQVPETGHGHDCKGAPQAKGQAPQAPRNGRVARQRLQDLGWSHAGVWRMTQGMDRTFTDLCECLTFQHPRAPKNDG